MFDVHGVSSASERKARNFDAAELKDGRHFWCQLRDELSIMMRV